MLVPIPKLVAVATPIFDEVNVPDVPVTLPVTLTPIELVSNFFELSWYKSTAPSATAVI